MGFFGRVSAATTRYSRTFPGRAPSRLGINCDAALKTPACSLASNAAAVGDVRAAVMRAVADAVGGAEDGALYPLHLFDDS